MDALALLEFVHRRLSEGEKFVQISASVDMGRNVLSRKLADSGWVSVYSKVLVDEKSHSAEQNRTGESGVCRRH